jgi:predicted Zn-dependent protease
MSLSRLDEARSALLEVVAQNSGHLEARRRLGELELALELPEEAARWLKPLVDAWPEDKAYCSLYAQALQEIGRTDEARPWWEAVRQAESALGRLEKLNESLKNDPTNPELRYEIGNLLLRFRSREDGAGWLKSLLQFDPTHHGAHEALADYYEKTGQDELSRQHRQLAREFAGGDHAS